MDTVKMYVFFRANPDGLRLADRWEFLESLTFCNMKICDESYTEDLSGWNSDSWRVDRCQVLNSSIASFYLTVKTTTITTATRSLSYFLESITHYGKFAT